MIWKIKIEADSEKKAVEYLKTLVKIFDLAVKSDSPMDSAYMEGKESLLTCEKTE